MWRAALAIAVSLVITGTSMAQQPPCTFKDPRVKSHLRWGGPVDHRVDVPWSLPWGSVAYDATKFYFDQSRDQLGFFWGSLKADGTGDITLEVRNGSKLDGDHFAVQIAVVGGQGEVLGSAEFAAGINAAGVCKAGSQGHSCWRKQFGVDYQMSPDQIRRIKVVRVRYALYDKLSDAIVLNNLKSAAQCIAAASGSGG